MHVPRSNRIPAMVLATLTCLAISAEAHAEREAPSGTDDDGIEHLSDGAFYFQNSGGQGETRPDPDSVSPELREDHPDYYWVPVGNEADSYTVFWKKWETGSIPSFSHSHWCLPIYPVDFVKAFSPNPDA